MEKETLFDTDISHWRGNLANRVLKFFRDSNGNIVIAQPPNPPIIVWGVASLLKLIFTTGLINVGLDLIAFGSLFTWAWMELFQGVNYFRRTLGFIVLVGFVGFRIYSYNPV
ncbi:hypothetical protein Sta7437_4868 (plasmid) [Stanieria cyanosphaera PCC 7437]|uniref:Uncharacterized protein n=1 Tax=Stanieria cyanosphaera (strain ATCC 29371 / PCC 7437) TaxID=111780 RepID=K9Y2P2_STAC7|nr:hypothetical protein [Stanieria cyanosphaera]AFZ38297.1 hypothetical protein Sta7437_4868 [Stanieria cyanosphaera PCC 7437]